ncbi:MAG: hypothetical protein KME38_24890 [Spirirestis rafaelensis WJT71-NPBG6]|nr:hypothetical protein [Spirirestis rafaelensis WJT71-NPBG6]
MMGNVTNHRFQTAALFARSLLSAKIRATSRCPLITTCNGSNAVYTNINDWA